MAKRGSDKLKLWKDTVPVLQQQQQQRNIKAVAAFLAMQLI